jgi:predicted RNase H-like nuclease
MIPWCRYHLRLDVTVRKENSPCRHAEEVIDTVVVALIFNRATMEKTNSPCPLAVAREKEINP